MVRIDILFESLHIRELLNDFLSLPATLWKRFSLQETAKRFFTQFCYSWTSLESIDLLICGTKDLLNHVKD